MATSESATIAEPSTGVQFPLVQQLWSGSPLRCLGAGPRVKKVGFVKVKVYAVALYADAGAVAAAARSTSGEAGRQVLMEGAFDKALQMHLVRGVTGKQFCEALDENLRPLMKGSESALDDFSGFFQGKQLEKGTEVTLMWRADGPTDVCLRPPSDATPYSQLQPGKSVASPSLGRALVDLYTSPDSPAPEAAKIWMAAVPALSAQVVES